MKMGNLFLRIKIGPLSKKREKARFSLSLLQISRKLAILLVLLKGSMLDDISKLNKHIF